LPHTYKKIGTFVSPDFFIQPLQTHIPFFCYDTNQTDHRALRVAKCKAVCTYVPEANSTIVSYNASSVKNTTPRVAQCVLKTKMFSCTLKNALAYCNAGVVDVSLGLAPRVDFTDQFRQEYFWPEFSAEMIKRYFKNSSFSRYVFFLHILLNFWPNLFVKSTPG
jgi:hypothetical protein